MRSNTEMKLAPQQKKQIIKCEQMRSQQIKCAKHIRDHNCSTLIIFNNALTHSESNKVKYLAL